MENRLSIRRFSILIDETIKVYEEDDRLRQVTVERTRCEWAHKGPTVVLLMTMLTSAAWTRSTAYHMLQVRDDVIYTLSCVSQFIDQPTPPPVTAVRSPPVARGCSELSAYLTIIDTGSLPVSSSVAPLSRLAATRRTNDRLYIRVPDCRFDATHRKWERLEATGGDRRAPKINFNATCYVSFIDRHYCYTTLLMLSNNKHTRDKSYLSGI